MPKPRYQIGDVVRVVYLDVTPDSLWERFIGRCGRIVAFTDDRDRADTSRMIYQISGLNPATRRPGQARYHSLYEHELVPATELELRHQELCDVLE